MYLRISISKMYLSCLFLWSILYSLANESTMSKTFQFLPTLFRLVWFAIRVFLIVKIAYKNTKKDVLISVLILMIGIISSFQSNSSFLEGFFWFLASAKGIKCNKSVKSLFYGQLIAFVVIVSFCCLGIIENNVIIRTSTGIVRYSMGYNHPNNLAAKILQLTLMYIYLIQSRLSIKQCIFGLIVTGVNYIITNSLTATLLLLCSIVLIIVYLFSIKNIILFSQLSRWLIKFLKFVFIAMAGFSIISAVTFKNNALIQGFDLTSTLSSRFTQMYYYLQEYSVKPWGQPLYYHGLDNKSNIFGLYTLDNAYMYLLLGLGAIAFMVFIGLYIITLHKSIKFHDRIVVIILAIYAIYGLLETVLIRFSYNFALVFLFSSVWGNDCLDRGHIIGEEEVNESFSREV